ncbi:MAG: hypothetical protein M0R80_07690 [Proteobacteria bacterium]|jgi:hypothetical protein|nr:hypothetical protein [Pseudomonadota bacterium]
MKTAIPVDRAKFERCIKEAEQTNHFPGLSALHAHVAAAYNVGAEHPIQPSVVGLRITSWGIPVKTQKGKRGRPGTGAPKPVVTKPVATDKPEVAESVAPAPVPAIEPAKPKSRWDIPILCDVEASQSMQMCGCRCINIMAPAGDCPAKLLGTEQETVIIWAEKVIQAGHAKGLHFSPSALKYFVRQFYDLDSEEHRLAVSHIQSMGYVKIQEGELPAPRMPVPIILPQPKPSKVADEEELEDVETQIKLAAVNLADIEEETLD